MNAILATCHRYSCGRMWHVFFVSFQTNRRGVAKTGGGRSVDLVGTAPCRPSTVNASRVRSLRFIRTSIRRIRAAGNFALFVLYFMKKKLG